DVDLAIEHRSRRDADLEVAEGDALDAQAARMPGERLRPEQDHDVLAGAGERAADQTADAAGAENRVSHASDRTAGTGLACLVSNGGEERGVSGKSDFSAEEWQLVTEGPATAGFIVSSAHSGGTFRETFALAKVWAEARQHHGQSELLDAIVDAKPHVDRHQYHSPVELRDVGLQRIHDAAALLDQKATPEEAEAYRGFVVTLAERVAAAHKEEGQQVSSAESDALDAIRSSVATGSG